MKTKDIDPWSADPRKWPKAKRDHSIGEYVADYSPVTPEELKQPTPELDELMKNSKPVGSR